MQTTTLGAVQEKETATATPEKGKMMVKLYQPCDVRELAGAIGIATPELLVELRDEKGMFADEMDEETILAPDTIERALEWRGMVPAWAERGPDEKLTNTEKKVLQFCAEFEATFGEFINGMEQSLSAKELAARHQAVGRELVEILAAGRSQTRQTPSRGKSQTADNITPLR